jgi:hypothetical protein
LLALTETVLEEGRKSGVFQPVNALHLASAVAGITVFFVSVIPSIAPQGSFDPLSPDHLAKHRRELLSVTRRLLGTNRTASPLTAVGGDHSRRSGRRLRCENRRPPPTQAPGGTSFRALPKDIAQRILVKKSYSVI